MDFSIVIPVYNSTQSLEILTDEISRYFMAIHASYEIIYVDDFSASPTYKILKRLSETEGVHVLFNDKNLGQQRTLLKGLKEASGNIVMTMDDDLQHDVRSLDEIIPHIKAGADLVFGVYENYGDQTARQWGSKLIGFFFKTMYKSLKGNHVSSYRVMTGDLCRKLVPPKQHFVYISAELLKHSKCVKNINIERRQRRYGKSGYNLMKCVKITLKLFWYYGICSKLKNQPVEDEA